MKVGNAFAPDDFGNNNYEYLIIHHIRHRSYPKKHGLSSISQNPLQSGVFLSCLFVRYLPYIYRLTLTDNESLLIRTCLAFAIEVGQIT